MKVYDLGCDIQSCFDFFGMNCSMTLANLKHQHTCYIYIKIQIKSEITPDAAGLSWCDDRVVLLIAFINSLLGAKVLTGYSYILYATKKLYSKS